MNERGIKAQREEVDDLTSKLMERGDSGCVFVAFTNGDVASASMMEERSEPALVRVSVGGHTIYIDRGEYGELVIHDSEGRKFAKVNVRHELECVKVHERDVRTDG